MFFFANLRSNLVFLSLTMTRSDSNLKHCGQSRGFHSNSCPCSSFLLDNIGWLVLNDSKQRQIENLWIQAICPCYFRWKNFSPKPHPLLYLTSQTILLEHHSNPHCINSMRRWGSTICAKFRYLSSRNGGQLSTLISTFSKSFLGHVSANGVWNRAKMQVSDHPESVYSSIFVAF